MIGYLGDDGHFLHYNPNSTDATPQAFRYSITNGCHWLVAPTHKIYSQDLLRYAHKLKSLSFSTYFFVNNSSSQDRLLSGLLSSPDGS